MAELARLRLGLAPDIAPSYVSAMALSVDIVLLNGVLGADGAPGWPSTYAAWMHLGFGTIAYALLWLLIAQVCQQARLSGVDGRG